MIEFQDVFSEEMIAGNCNVVEHIKSKRF